MSFTTVRIFKEDKELVKKKTEGKNFAERLHNILKENDKTYLTELEIKDLIERKIQNLR